MVSKQKKIVSFYGLALCLIFSFHSNILFAASVVLSWVPPSANNDQTPLNDLAGYNVYFGTASGNYSEKVDVGNVLTYQVNNLSTGVTYYFTTTAYDTSGNESGYSNEVIKTFPVPDTTAPVVSGIQATNITSSSVTIAWTTNEASDTRVEYGTSVSYGSTTTVNTAMVTSHSQNISGLAASKLYHYRVVSRDSSGNQAVSGDYTFTTPAPPDTTAPAVSGVQATNITSSSVTIEWTTNEASDTRVEYGTSVSYGSTTTVNTVMVTSHSQNISGLTASKLYHYRVVSRDSSGNQAVSGDYTFTTQALPVPVDYYCDSDNDGYINISKAGSCTGSGCAPAGCQLTPGNDCNDIVQSINPGIKDDTCDGIDNNCDGTPDNHFVIAAISCGTGVCTSTGQIICQSGTEVNTCSPGIRSESSETTCGDGLDNDCDGLVDEDCFPDIKVSNVLLSEDFSSGIPATWSIQGGWSADNSCGQTITYPFSGKYAIVDSSCTTTDVEELITEPVDTVACSSVALTYSNQYYSYSGNIEVDVSNDGGTTWSNNISIGADDGYPAPNWKEIDISSIADATDAQIKFRYANSTANGYWALDNVWVTCQSNQLDFSSEMQAASSRTLMISNPGTDILTINAIDLGGPDASEFSIGANDNCTNQALHSDETCTVDVVFTPKSAGLKNAILAIASNDPDTSIVNVPLAGVVTNIINPAPVIKVNNSSGIVNIARGGNIAVSLELDPGSFIGTNADWWVLMEYRNRWYYYDSLTNKWRRGYSFYKQGQLDSMGPVNLLNNTRWYSGRYTLYFGVDTAMNGIQDSGKYYYDTVIVDVQ
ncbi:MAG: choice-of-anchor D domain-containing protein [Nitrospirae bacterium]|nr:choice-of-anchor D domain-containing protein [Nitrospirota bacterium]